MNSPKEHDRGLCGFANRLVAQDLTNQILKQIGPAVHVSDVQKPSIPATVPAKAVVPLGAAGAELCAARGRVG